MSSPIPPGSGPVPPPVPPQNQPPYDPHGGGYPQEASRTYAIGGRTAPNESQNQYPSPHYGPPNSRPSLPAGFVAAVAFAIGFVLLRGISQVAQVAFQYGDLFTVSTMGQAKAVMVVLILLPVLVVLPALLWMRRGPRVDGRPLAGICVVIALAAGVLAMPLLMLLPEPSGDAVSAFEDGIFFSSASDVLTAAAAITAWIVTRRASRWSLAAVAVAAIFGPLAVRAGQQNSVGAEDNSFAGQVESLFGHSGPDYGEYFGTTVTSAVLIVLTLVAAAWAAVGIDKIVASLRGPLPPAPTWMFAGLSDRRRESLHLTAYAVLAATFIPIAAMVYAALGSSATALLWLLLQAVVYLLLTVAGRHADRQHSGAREIWWGCCGVAAVSLALQVVLVLTAGYAEVGTGGLFGFVALTGPVALAAMFIVALTDRPWGIPAAALAYLAPHIVLGDYAHVHPLLAQADSMSRTVVTMIVFGAVVALGVGLSRLVDKVLADPGRFGIQVTGAQSPHGPKIQPYGPPPGAPGAPVFPQHGPVGSNPAVPISGMSNPAVPRPGMTNRGIPAPGTTNPAVPVPNLMPPVSNQVASNPAAPNLAEPDPTTKMPTATSPAAPEMFAPEPPSNEPETRRMPVQQAGTPAPETDPQ